MSTVVYVKQNNEKEAGMISESQTNSRVLRILNFMAERPTDTFTLSQLARELDLSLGSAHRVLSTMTQYRYLYRHPVHKTYSLGVALVAVGQAALETNRGIDMARVEAHALAAELQALCLVTTVVDDEVLFLAREGVPQSSNGLYRTGERRAYMPPFNLVRVAWAGKQEVDEYFRLAESYLDPDTVAFIRSVLPVVRARGYAMAANRSGLQQITHRDPLPLAHSSVSEPDTASRRLARELSREEIFLRDAEIPAEGVAYIAAPVFSASGQVAFELTLTGLPTDLDEVSLKRYTNRLCATADLITNKTYGKFPIRSRI